MNISLLKIDIDTFKYFLFNALNRNIRLVFIFYSLVLFTLICVLYRLDYKIKVI